MATRGLRLLVTTRPLEDAELNPLKNPGVGRYQLEPFSRQRLRDFASRWFGAGEHGALQAARFLRQVQQAGPSELVRVPLMATIAAIVYERRPGQDLPGPGTCSTSTTLPGCGQPDPRTPARSGVASSIGSGRCSAAGNHAVESDISGPHFFGPPAD
jgi:hypothetical protein